jgi:integrase
MITTECGQEFEVWTIRERKGRRKPWELRWRVNDRRFSKSFKTKELAKARDRALMKAARAGAPFDLATGEPESWGRASESVYDAVVAYARHAWGATTSGNTRRTVEDNGVRLILAGVDDRAAKRSPAPGTPKDLRRALAYALRFRIDPEDDNPETRTVPVDPPDDHVAACLEWVRSVSRPVGDVAGSPAAALALLDRACLRLDGKQGSAATRRRRRGVWSGVLRHAVEVRGTLSAHPLAGVTTVRSRSADAVVPRTVPDWEQGGRLLRAVEFSANPADRRLWAFFLVAFIVGTRPGETRALRADDITWPEDAPPSAYPGWGVLTVGGARTDVDAAYTDNGEHGETRGLKGQAEGAVRLVPLPPEAVAALRDHIDTYGTAPDGRLFWYPTKADPFGVVPGKAYRRTWMRARKAALTDAEKRLGVAERPYDLRHGCATIALGEGLPPTEVAHRLGHTLEVLLTVYAHWLRSGEREASARLQAMYDRRGPLTGQRPENRASVTNISRSAA